MISRFFFKALNAAITDQNPWNYGYLTQLNIEKGKNITFDVIPYALIDDGTWLHVLDGEDKALVMEYLKKLCDIIQDRKELERYFDAWCVISGVGYAGSLPIYDKAFEADELTPEQLKVLARTRNVFSCESHNYLLRSLLRMEFDGRTAEARKSVDELLELRKVPKLSCIK